MAINLTGIFSVARGEICQPKRSNGRGGTEPAKVRVNMAEVSRGRESRVRLGERSEGSVIGRCS